jgi:hypothetical protein
VGRTSMGVWGCRSIRKRTLKAEKGYDGQFLNIEHWNISFSALCTLHSALNLPIPFIPVKNVHCGGAVNCRAGGCKECGVQGVEGKGGFDV